MQIYKTFATSKTDTQDIIGTSWQASQTEASKRRVALKKDGYKTESQTVNIPTAKGPLIEWLNENVTA